MESMKASYRLFLLLGLLSAGLLSGCATKTEDETTIPWSRPATWEGTAPGFGGSGF